MVPPCTHRMHTLRMDSTAQVMSHVYVKHTITGRLSARLKASSGDSAAGGPQGRIIWLQCSLLRSNSAKLQLEMLLPTFSVCVHGV
jgi:hypothetical protein